MALPTFYSTPDGQLLALNEKDAIDQALFLGTVNTAESITLSADPQTRLVRIQANYDLWYNFDAAAVKPTTEDVTGAGVYLPAGQERYIYLNGLDHKYISCISAVDDCIVNLLEWE